MFSRNCNAFSVVFKGDLDLRDRATYTGSIVLNPLADTDKTSIVVGI